MTGRFPERCGSISKALVVGALCAFPALCRCSKEKAKKKADRKPEASSVIGRKVAGKTDAWRFMTKVDLDKLRKTALWKRVVKLGEVGRASGHKVFALLKDRCKLDPFADLDHLFSLSSFGPASSKSKSDRMRFVLILSGRFKSELLACVSQLLQAEGISVTEDTLEGKKAIRFKDQKGREFIAAALADGSAGVASKELSSRLLGKDSISMRIDGALRGMGLGLDSLASVVFPDLPGPVKRLFSNNPLLGPVSVGSVAFAAHGIEGGYQVNMAFGLGSDQEAQRAVERASTMKALLGRKGGRAPARAAMIKALVDRASFHSKGPIFRISLSLSEDQVLEMVLNPFKRYMRKAKESKIDPGARGQPMR